MQEEPKIKLFKTGKNEISGKLNYMFRNSNGIEWKRKYNVMCSIKGVSPLPQEDLTDQEYFQRIYPPIEDTGNIIHYYLLVENEPTTYISLTKDPSDLVDITFTTSKKFVGQAHATKSVELIEEMLFKDNTIRGIKLLDQNSTANATTKIAFKLGFTPSEEDSTLFIKLNPNYRREPENRKTH